MGITKTEMDNEQIIRFTGDVFCNFLCPCIYIWKRGNHYLYIGCSTRGFSRIFDRRHHALDPKKVLASDTLEVRFYYNISTETLLIMEAKLIDEHRPKYNQKGCEGHREDILSERDKKDIDGIIQSINNRRIGSRKAKMPIRLPDINLSDYE